VVSPDHVDVGETGVVRIGAIRLSD